MKSKKNKYILLKKFYIVTLILTILLLISPCSKRFQKNKISILYTGAIYGRLEECEDCGYTPMGGFGRIKSFFKKFEKDNRIITIDCGNIFRDKKDKKNEFKDNLIKQILNNIKYDILSIGRFDNVSNYSNINSKILSTNYVLKNNNYISKVIRFHYTELQNLSIYFYSIYEDGNFDENIKRLQQLIQSNKNENYINILIANLKFNDIKKLTDKIKNFAFILWTHGYKGS